jgi:HlyD family secretion protein
MIKNLFKVNSALTIGCITRSRQRGLRRHLLDCSLLILGVGGLLAQETPTLTVKDYKVQPVELHNNLLFTGELQAARSYTVTVPETRSSFGNTVTYMPLEGTQVQKGELITEFDAAALAQQQLDVERRVNEAKLQIDKKRADLDAQQIDLQINTAAQETNVKVAKLYAAISKDMLPENQYQLYQVNLDRAELALTKAKESYANFQITRKQQMSLVELTKAQADIDAEKLDNDLKLLQIHAPQDGVVMYADNMMNSRKVQIGDSLFSGLPVMTLPDLANLQVVSFIYDMEVQLIKTGMPATFSLDALPGKSWKARIASITSIAVRKSFLTQQKVFKAVIQLLDPADPQMKPGMTARVEIPVLVGGNVVAVPREFLQMDASGEYYVIKSPPEKGKEGLTSKVRVGASSARLIQITEGLSAGDTVYRMVVN